MSYLLKGTGPLPREWYLAQNKDVLKSQLNPLLHYFKYGRKEFRTWYEPAWFKRALGRNGWVWKQNTNVLDSLSLDITQTKLLYKEISIYRIKNYSKEFKSLRNTFNTNSFTGFLSQNLKDKD